MLKELDLSTCQAESMFETVQAALTVPSGPAEVSMFDKHDPLLSMPAALLDWLLGVQTLSQTRGPNNRYILAPTYPLQNAIGTYAELGASRSSIGVCIVLGSAMLVSNKSVTFKTCVAFHGGFCVYCVSFLLLLKHLVSCMAGCWARY